MEYRGFSYATVRVITPLADSHPILSKIFVLGLKSSGIARQVWLLSYRLGNIPNLDIDEWD